MKVRIIRDCYQRMKPGAKNTCFSVQDDADTIVDWEGKPGQKLPACFEQVTVREVVVEPVEEEPSSLMALDRDSQVMEALNRMDHAASEQWTSDGLPQIKTISSILGEMGFPKKVERADINVAWPGFVREQ